MTKITYANDGPRPQHSRGFSIGKLTHLQIVFATYVVMTIALAVAVRGFISTDNLLGLLQSVAILGIVALGMGVIVIARGIDLSMVATLAIAPALFLKLAQDGHPIWLAFLVLIAVTAVFGAINGWLIAYAEVPALFTTLASGLLLYGLGRATAFKIDNVMWPEQLLNWQFIGRAAIFGIPIPVVLFFGTAAIIGLILKRSRFGLFVYAIGDNPSTARKMGIATRPVIVLLYTASALLAAFAGLVMAASLNAMPVRVFTSTLAYDVILVVVLGGIGLAGGRGGALNVVIGTLFIGTLLNAMTLLDLGYAMQNLIKGLILLTVIAADSIANPRNEETAQHGDI